ncbi:hypothetical protein EK21DRAFT_118433 [Setomelanomma holmii]|uniref:Uncharacterized protein n=1 Tax=Setomelanomma holmii TaxID=210430 RepID=A0A9P4GXG3_9PLEO|nr:hypothetical protein EK21DRAFT_118433 [Setomelanomma holmii]
MVGEDAQGEDVVEGVRDARQCTTAVNESAVGDVGAEEGDLAGDAPFGEGAGDVDIEQTLDGVYHSAEAIADDNLGLGDEVAAAGAKFEDGIARLKVDEGKGGLRVWAVGDIGIVVSSDHGLEGGCDVGDVAVLIYGGGCRRRIET